MLSPRLRDLAVTTHIIASVGWLGSVLVFLVLAITGLARDGALANAMYVAMQAVAWRTIVPGCFATLATGVLVSLGTRWGLFRHYWVVIKLVMTVIATLFLLLHTRPIDELARAAAAGSVAEHHGLRVQLIVDSAAALVVLVVATVLAVFKPRGMTRYGQRRAPERPLSTPGLLALLSCSTLPAATAGAVAAVLAAAAGTAAEDGVELVGIDTLELSGRWLLGGVLHGDELSSNVRAADKRQLDRALIGARHTRTAPARVPRAT